jgi:ABC-type amino acid transport substrate-binding protein
MRLSRLWPLPLVVLLLAIPACGDDDDDDGAASSTTSQGQELDLEKDGVLTVGTELPAPPFWIGDDYDSITGGFEVELAREMAKRLDLDDVEFVEMPFAGVVAGQECPCDIDFSQVTITPARAKAAQFTEPYFDADQGVLANPGVEVKNIEDARSIRWGAQVTTTGAAFLTDKVKPETEPRQYNTTVDAFTALKAGQIDAVLLDVPIVVGAVDAGQVGDAEVIAKFETDEEYGGIVNKDSPNLDRFNEIIQEMKDDGFIDDLIPEFFDPNPLQLPTIDVG